METIQLEGTVRADSSISHNGGQSFGISQKLRREKFVQPDFTTEEIPVISGNGMRGMLRDRGMWHFCKALGYGPREENGETKVDGLSLSAFYFLFSGGSLNSSGKGLDIERAREIRRLIPLVGVFGGAVGNQIMPGKLKIGKLLPICAETLHLIPEKFRAEKAQSIWEYVQEEMYTRKDDEKNEKLRTMIDRKGLPEGMQRKLLPGGDKEEDKGPPQQMMYFVETLTAGTQFYWRIVLEDLTEVEREAFFVCLAEFARLPYIGGKSGVGLGQVSFHFPGYVSVDSRHTTGQEIAAPLGALYHSHLTERGGEIRELLKTL